MRQAPRTQQTQTNHKPAASKTQQTLIDHLHELRSRLFWLILLLIVASSASYLIKDQVMAALMNPLGGQRLIYITPIGGFNFIFKVSLYFGIACILPAIIYHLYRFLEPIMDTRRKKSVVLYCVASFLLAIGGACFAYFGSLPAALHFLTSFDIQNVSAMLTVDSYLAFVVTYVLGFAVLFQIPLILMIINSVKPIPPKKLLSSERFVVLIAFIAAAIISPTPDITNQTILAVPIILMYQVGVLCVWMQSRSLKRKDRHTTARTDTPTPQPVIRRATLENTNNSSLATTPLVQPHPTSTSSITTNAVPKQPQTIRNRAIMDVSASRPHHHTIPARNIRTASNTRLAPQRVQPSRTAARARTIDGFAPRQQQASQAS